MQSDTESIALSIKIPLGSPAIGDSLFKDDVLKMRMNIWISPNKENYDSFIAQGPYKTDRLHVNGFKLYADGALGSRGACMLEPYSDDPGNKGLVMHKPDFYDNVCSKAIKYGYQVNTHAIGDSGVRMVLDLYAKYLKGPNDLRWRIEHSQIVHPDDFQQTGSKVLTLLSSYSRQMAGCLMGPTSRWRILILCIHFMLLWPGRI